MEQLHKIGSLFKCHNASGLLSYLNNKAVIAGGSVMYALNTTSISSESVGDVDLFILNDGETFRHVIEFIKFYFEPLELTYRTFEFDQNEITVVTIMVPNERVSFQVIMTEHKTALDVIQKFDIDCVQCAIYGGAVFQTPYCVISHNDRKVHRVTNYHYHKNRLLKPSLKGFSIPLFLNKNAFTPKPEMVTVTFDRLVGGKVTPLIEGHRYINRVAGAGDVDVNRKENAVAAKESPYLNQVVDQGIYKRKIKYLDLDNMHIKGVKVNRSIKLNDGMMEAFYLDFLLGNENQTIAREYVTIQLDISGADKPYGSDKYQLYMKTWNRIPVGRYQNRRERNPMAEYFFPLLTVCCDFDKKNFKPGPKVLLVSAHRYYRYSCYWEQEQDKKAGKTHVHTEHCDRRSSYEKKQLRLKVWDIFEPESSILGLPIKEDVLTYVMPKYEEKQPVCLLPTIEEEEEEEDEIKKVDNKVAKTVLATNIHCRGCGIPTTCQIEEIASRAADEPWIRNIGCLKCGHKWTD